MKKGFHNEENHSFERRASMASSVVFSIKLSKFIPSGGFPNSVNGFIMYLTESVDGGSHERKILRTAERKATGHHQRRISGVFPEFLQEQSYERNRPVRRNQQVPVVPLFPE